MKPATKSDGQLWWRKCGRLAQWPTFHWFIWKVERGTHSHLAKCLKYSINMFGKEERNDRNIQGLIYCTENMCGGERGSRGTRVWLWLSSSLASISTMHIKTGRGKLLHMKEIYLITQERKINKPRLRFLVEKYILSTGHIKNKRDTKLTFCFHWTQVLSVSNSIS